MNNPVTTILTAQLLTSERDCQSVEALHVRVAIETVPPRIVASRNLLDRCRTMMADKKTDDLTFWLPNAVDSKIASFASDVSDDEAAMWAAIVKPWSNDQTKGQVTELKLVKRQMYGRSKIDLLLARTA